MRFSKTQDKIKSNHFHKLSRITYANKHEITYKLVLSSFHKFSTTMSQLLSQFKQTLNCIEFAIFDICREWWLNMIDLTG
jgi:hypothetical protein